MMLQWMGREKDADVLGRAVDSVIAKGIVTPDLWGSYSTMDVSDAIAGSVSLLIHQKLTRSYPFR
jgi:methanogen homoisocitrate dehydrogenase